MDSHLRGDFTVMILTQWCFDLLGWLSVETLQEHRSSTLNITLVSTALLPDRVPWSNSLNPTQPTMQL